MSPNGSFTPALFWESGIPAFATGPIYDQTYQTGFNGTGSGGAVTYGDPNSQPPRYQNWNLSVQRSLTQSLVVTAAYVGSNGKQLRGGGRSAYSNQLDPKYLVLGNLLTQNATPANVTRQPPPLFQESSCHSPPSRGPSLRCCAHFRNIIA